MFFFSANRNEYLINRSYFLFYLDQYLVYRDTKSCDAIQLFRNECVDNRLHFMLNDVTVSECTLVVSM